MLGPNSRVRNGQILGLRQIMKRLLIVALLLAIAGLSWQVFKGNKVSQPATTTPVPATAEVQPEPVTTTQNQTPEEPAPVAQVQGDSAINVVEITFHPRFTFATSPSVNTTNGTK